MSTLANSKDSNSFLMNADSQTEEANNIHTIGFYLRQADYDYVEGKPKK